MPLPKKETPAGAPDWVLTYGDMMSLLLCFFILLAAMANFDKQDKMMMATIESIREAFGAPGQYGWMIDQELALNAADRDLFHIQRTRRRRATRRTKASSALTVRSARFARSTSIRWTE